MTDKICFAPTGDIELEEAMNDARSTFKIYWREMSWEMRRIIPALALSAVKLSFPTKQQGGTTPSMEYMWVDNVSFDGEYIEGILLNHPQYIDDFQVGDRVVATFDRLCDWLYVSLGKSYGGFTVQTFRTRMDVTERQEHDRAWGIDFGDPEVIWVSDDLSLAEFRSYPAISLPEHPMAINMVPQMGDTIARLGDTIDAANYHGLTLLQFESLAGNYDAVRLLLECGANKSIANDRQQTALDLATLLKWDKIINLLQHKD
jgi:uncharacterized protein YegJ (DUF2314 family)